VGCPGLKSDLQTGIIKENEQEGELRMKKFLIGGEKEADWLGKKKEKNKVNVP